MKRILFFSMLAVFLCISLSTNAQVGYSVTFDWDDSNCTCTAIKISAMVVIRTYPGGNLVDASDWYEISVSPATVYDEATSLQDCDEPCYNVAVIVKVEDASGQCCYGSENENTIGQYLKIGYDFQTEVVLY